MPDKLIFHKTNETLDNMFHSNKNMKRLPKTMIPGGSVYAFHIPNFQRELIIAQWGLPQKNNIRVEALTTVKWQNSWQEKGQVVIPVDGYYQGDVFYTRKDSKPFVIAGLLLNSFSTEQGTFQYVRTITQPIVNHLNKTIQRTPIIIPFKNINRFTNSDIPLQDKNTILQSAISHPTVVHDKRTLQRISA